jgi:hypothetical protein
VSKSHSACTNHSCACQNHTLLAGGYCTLRVEITLVRVVIADQRVKSHFACGNRTLLLEIKLVRVEITLVRVVITLIRVKITL